MTPATCTLCETAMEREHSLLKKKEIFKEVSGSAFGRLFQVATKLRSLFWLANICIHMRCCFRGGARERERERGKLIGGRTIIVTIPNVWLAISCNYDLTWVDSFHINYLRSTSDWFCGWTLRKSLVEPHPTHKTIPINAVCITMFRLNRSK